MPNQSTDVILIKPFTQSSKIFLTLNELVRGMLPLNSFKHLLRFHPLILEQTVKICAGQIVTLVAYGLDDAWQSAHM